jgi:Ca2+-transporting ATPase
MKNYLFYQKPVKLCFKQQNLLRDGLAREEADECLVKEGLIKSKKKKKPPITIFFSQLRDPLIYVLIIAAIFTFIIGEYIDMWIILAVLIIDAIVGFS